MTQAEHKTGPAHVPNVSELFARYLSRQAAQAPEAGDWQPEVEPFDASATPRTDPRAAWRESGTVLEGYQPGGRSLLPAAPSAWSACVAQACASAAVSMALGTFPQQVRDLAELLRTDGRLAGPTRRQAPAVSGSAAGCLSAWAGEAARSGRPGFALTAAGVLRAAGLFERAVEVLAECRRNLPATWQAACGNEEAALAWQSGRSEEAARLWRSLPECVPVLFNRGLAELATGNRAAARQALDGAAAGLPEADSWHHLARVYRTLAARTA